MFPFDIPNVFRSILTGDSWSKKTTDTDTKVTVSCKGLFYWHSDIFIWLRITVKNGKSHSVSLLEMRLLGNRHESSNLSVSATNACKHYVCGHFYFWEKCSVKNLIAPRTEVAFEICKCLKSQFRLLSRNLNEDDIITIR